VHALGAEPIVLDLLDPRAVRKAVVNTKSDAIVHQATALAGLSDFKHFDRSFAQTNRLRTDGTDALLAAAQAAQVGRFVAQSYACHRYARQGGPVKTEEDPLNLTPVPAMRQTEAAMAYLDQAVTHAGGIALRYGNFYGDPDDGLVEAVRTPSVPIVGRGGGVWSFVHLDDAAAPFSRSTTTAPAFTTSSTTSPPPPARGCQSLRESSEPSRPGASPACSPGSSPARHPWSWGPSPAAPPTPRRSASSAGPFDTHAGDKASSTPTREPPRARGIASG